MMKYFVFVKEGYDRQYWCVAGNEMSLEQCICFLTKKEADKYAERLNNEKEKINQPGSTS